MRHPWIRHRPGPEENRKAAGIALGLAAALAAVVFYFARLFLARERIDRPGELSGDAGPEGWPRNDRVGPGGREAVGPASSAPARATQSRDAGSGEE